MKIISWNINSLRLRLPLLKKFIAQANPDIVCLQEIKVSDVEFPLLEVKSLGFDFVEFFGEKSYNGVAIFSKFPLIKTEKIDVLFYGHKRHISATLATKLGEVDLHNFYVPAGGDIPDPGINDKFDHKLKFIDWMSEFFAPQKNKKIIMVGDMNIAPLEHDVWSHRQLLDVVSHTPIEVEKMMRLQNTLNWIDTHRFFVPENEKLYSWWSYRALDPFKSNRGRRLDHIWTTPNLESRIKTAKIYKDFRIENQPSDHVPIETVFDLL
ncbi:MAG: exodeoxyribonuclease III [Alphaproteobacteria bacterium RIFCSPLOWO2_01_FULL_40_26]|nr:MAG: exodeoxyribonuclease III [Alphaproteobacteria bacterium RIFCSPHIGHO2_02_FULL_40_34]OFW88928.1 MAG: exodeoxyribonuclease III [Alphaproteobacteria bacterium RIFCSPHIGHO2_01_FULL_40_8]OFW95527.1 MAG: exodeoxyribonuclease III [Alphaproteobacteria bacterium RIFCSPLOWO2_01_FULL_40_26]OFX09633.1 MAG: exodeoxyribonuclease III [Alphaproteobacteria bacterium RIFCSPLOWO2_02_FULL_40_19]OFX11346.1 MAG: exodeoxyribonuclease III [Alphaproteobacteria bacterium RIFCSPLOWO2_12_FULL_40_11]